ncbi:MAG: LacI family transcriptional regulator [Clostridiales bacterium]|nr:LacI family transcriptional regulator [Clostridiales bacterium]
MKINIKDVAKKAGVSISTVSRVVNESKVVRQETHKKVMKVIEELGYKPNAIARSLKIKTTKTIGILIPDISIHLYPEIVRGIEDIASMYKYNIFLCNTDLDSEKELQYYDALSEKQVDGIILISNTVSDELNNKIEEYGIPTISIGSDYKELPSVTIDKKRASREIVDYLMDRGHNRIAFITDVKTVMEKDSEKLTGYKEALKEADIEYSEDLVVSGGYHYKDGYEGAKRLLKLKERPSAIYAASDEMAIGVVRATLELGLNIPDDVAIVGFNNIDMTAKVFPSITTVAQPLYEMGAIAMRVLTKIINNETLETTKIVLNYSLLERESS